MGCGASQQQEQAPPPKEEGPKPLTQAEKNAIAAQALKDAMSWALDQSLMFTKKVESWVDDAEIKIKVPVQEKIDSLLEKVAKVPLVGGSLAEALKKTTDPFEEAFADAAMTIAASAKTRTKFSEVIDGITVDDAIVLCRAGGVSACVDYVKAAAEDKVKAALEPIVEEIMSEHTLTNIWGGFIEKFNAAADKVSAVDPIEFNLNQYVMECAIGGIFTVMMRKEGEMRKAPGQAVSAAVRQAFGSPPDQWKRQ
eukprot:TRINITY_DN32426_c0_g1_i1.p1 TRINITY_DN32426_c0_g1~~TRINITY_DN32426_c0_g1_i1.p1  ORF type:complete len:253 (+),score=116.81 TRINITY_DN32426_c0_g1_i1:63-821(+)